jgi:hypothetical protein
VFFVRLTKNTSKIEAAVALLVYLKYQFSRYDIALSKLDIPKLVDVSADNYLNSLGF